MSRKTLSLRFITGILALLLLLVSCNNTPATEIESTDPVIDPNTCSHSWTDATCDSPKSCTKCGETEGEALGHSLDADQKCTRCGADLRYVVSYTYAIGTQKLGTSWNPHTLKTDADKTIFNYITSPLVDISIKDSANGIYQWVYEMATSVKDVTSDYTNDLVKYGVTLPDGISANDVKSGYVYEIKLNPDAAWENGEKITADDYIYSMQMLLHPKFRNLRAKAYYDGEFAIAGGIDYFNSGAPIYELAIDLETEETKQGHDLFLNLNTGWVLSSSYSLKSMYENGYIKDEYQTTVDENGNKVYVLDENGEKIQTGFAATYYNELAAKENEFGYIPISNEDMPKVEAVIDMYLAAFGLIGEEHSIYRWTHYYYQNGTFDNIVYDGNVGLYKVDDYTLHYVCQNKTELSSFLISCTTPWLVYKPLYSGDNDELIDKSGALWTTSYGTSIESTMSYGPYKLESLMTDKKITFIQNENWYGFEKNQDGTPKRDEEGNLISYTSFFVDGRPLRQYTTTNIKIEVMEYDAAKFAFIKGELSEWYPSADDLSQYTESEKLAQIDEAYVMSFFFNTKLDALTHLDSKGENKNSAVLSSYNFRKAFSLALDRTELAMSTPAYKPAFTLMSDVYSYDIINNPMSYYRKSEQAMKAILDLYGIKYGSETAFSTLEDAYYYITGYNLTEAKKLMKQAHDELVAAGVYNSGEEIKIKIAWSKTALNHDDLRQVEILNKLINASIKDSGFGIITFEAVGFVNNRYDDVPYGKYAMGYGAWGDTTADPFKYMELHCNNYVPVNERPCWDPHFEKLTINIGGKDVTMTWEKWSQACTTGEYADADFATKLFITATMEKEFLNLYHHIPLYTTTTTHLISYKHEYYTHKYNSMYGFGGLRLIFHNYDDTTWVKVVAAEGGTFNYAN